VRLFATARSVRAGRFTDTVARVAVRLVGAELVASKHRRDSTVVHVERDGEKRVGTFDRADHESPVIGIRTVDDFDPVALAVVLHDAMVAPKCAHCGRPSVK
jgi:hypothetical protein